jgi:arylsulfatase A-like enzyme
MKLPLLLALALCLLLPPQTHAAAPPNILVILADDQGWGDLSIHGNTNLSTPHIDALARAGALMDRFMVCPVCSPTRAEFLTGRYFPRTGVRGVSSGQERLNLVETTIAQRFQQAGYATGAFGKWHNGSQHPYHPNARGFDEFYGFCSGHWGHYFDSPMDHNGRTVQGKGFLIDDLAEHAMEFISRHRDRPFFCYFPANTPHSPMQVPDSFYAKFQNASLALRGTHPNSEDPLHTRAALAMCENLDWNVGRLLDKLDELQLTQNTIVVYFSDNGPNGSRWNGGMKGIKGSLDEGGLRVPCIFRWPGKIPAGTLIPQVASSIDLLPTLAELASLPSPKEPQLPIDGVSLSTLLLDPKPASHPWPEREIFSVSVSGAKLSVSARNSRFRLTPSGALYDPASDPGQNHDLAAQHPEETQRLQNAVARFSKEVIPSPFLQPEPRPYTIGFSESTSLPADEGVPHGTIRRSAKAPNCSYFTHWTNPSDSITWDIEVGAEATYEVSVHYVCSPNNTGIPLECRFENLSTSATLSTPNDPPALGAEQDRAPRHAESYVKSFQPFVLGRLPLKKGRGTLVLRALQIPGNEAMEVRSVTLRKLPQTETPAPAP